MFIPIEHFAVYNSSYYQPIRVINIFQFCLVLEKKSVNCVKKIYTLSHSLGMTNIYAAYNDGNFGLLEKRPFFSTEEPIFAITERGVFYLLSCYTFAIKGGKSLI